MILNDKQIRDRCIRPWYRNSSTFVPMIDPYVPVLVNKVNDKKIISYGSSSFGYDLRVGYSFKIFNNTRGAIVDPKEIDNESYIDVEVEEGGYVIIPPNSFVLAHALEKLNMPNDVTGIIVGKSTLARSCINVLATPAEAGWSGYLTLEFANTSSLPVKMYAGEGSCQILFLKGKKCGVSYADRNGKYMDQGREITLGRV